MAAVTPAVELSLVAAVDQRNLLAVGGRIPWHLPDDILHFRRCCAGRWLLLGRTTYQQMTGWFKPDHTPLVMSASCGWDPPVGRVVASVPQALAMTAAGGVRELVCIGGGSVFAAALPYATRVILTQIEHTFPAGSDAVFFPELSPQVWQGHEVADHPKDTRHACAYKIVEYTRRQLAGAV